MTRRAGAVADLGAVGVPGGIWASAAPLGVTAVERLRLHPYLTERVLGRCSGLRPVAAVAGAHHERLDGSGYHRGSAGPLLPPAARILAAAECGAPSARTGHTGPRTLPARPGRWPPTR